jgi:membrane glycosyltransferase
MQACPRLGILQSLVTGAPTSSAFARIFQFGMRLGMRTYTMGQAWWTGDCGPFWGHNALVRVKPFAEHCVLSRLAGRPPLGGDILSHDQVEAALMRRAGFEVRVMPVETGSYEDSPPDALEFERRDVRWCQGNMQYLKLIGLPGLQPVSRFQLFWSILMFIGVPAWTLLLALLPLAAFRAQSSGVSEFPSGSAKALYLVLLLMYCAPKLTAMIDAALRRDEVKRFGGALRFAAGVVLEFAFTFLLGAISSLRISIFMVGLLFGRSTTWGNQRRDGHGVPWAVAFSALWPQLVFGVAVSTALAIASPEALLWSLPLMSGFLLAIPFTVLTASPLVGRVLQRHGVAGIPEDFATPPELQAVQTPDGR